MLEEYDPMWNVSRLWTFHHRTLTSLQWEPGAFDSTPSKAGYSSDKHLWSQYAWHHAMSLGSWGYRIRVFDFVWYNSTVNVNHTNRIFLSHRWRKTNLKTDLLTGMRSSCYGGIVSVSETCEGLIEARRYILGGWEQLLCKGSWEEWGLKLEYVGMLIVETLTEPPDTTYCLLSVGNSHWSCLNWWRQGLEKSLCVGGTSAEEPHLGTRLSLG